MLQYLVAQEQIVLLVVGEFILHEVGGDPLDFCNVALHFVVRVIDEIRRHARSLIDPIQIFDERVGGASYLDDGLGIGPVL